MTRKPIHRFLPLTYKPKIPGVLKGWITQSIRIDTDLQVGDFIAFHGWTAGRYSPWSFRTPFMEIRHAEPITIRKDSIYFPQGMIGFVPCKVAVKACDLDYLAALDGIEPATGEELIRVLRSMHGKGTLHGKVLRWDPEPIKNEAPLRSPQVQDAINQFYQKPIQQVHATITSALTSPGQDFVQLGDIKDQGVR